MRRGFQKDMIAKVLGGAPKHTLADLEKMYPPRDLPVGAMVSRFAPSPTGFMHIGNFYGMMIDKKLAQQSGGVFFLRIEDTDSKREVAGAVDLILYAAKVFGLVPDEMPECAATYGPYLQTERKDIYKSVAAELLERGLAYPCFLSASEIENIRSMQKSAGLPTGIYGEWAP
ncbi:MAG: hypothetical protein LBB08_00005, partial [Rickettsiales bacterium]|nr:hypothetical protein [Rickettsiales bacterium]